MSISIQPKTVDHMPASAIASALIAVFLWSIFPIAVHDLGLSEGPNSGIPLVFYNLLATTVIAFAYTRFRRKEFESIRKQTARSKGAVLSLAIASLFRFGYVFFVFRAYAKGPILETIVLVELYPIFLILLIPLIARNFWSRITVKDGILSICGFIGAVLIIGPDFRTSGIAKNIGVIFALIAGFSNALDNAFLARFREKIVDVKRRDVVVFELFITSLASCIIFFFIGAAEPLHFFPPFTTLWATHYCILFVPLAAACWQYALYLAGKSSISTLWYIYPCISAFLAISIFEKAPPSDTTVFGMAIVILSNVYLHARQGRGISGIGTRVTIVAAFAICELTAPIEFVEEEWRIVRLIATVFAILAGFVVSRVWNRAIAQDALFADLSAHLHGVIYSLPHEFKTKGKAIADKLFQRVVDLDHSRSQTETDNLVSEIYTIESEFHRILETAPIEHAEVCDKWNSTMASLDRWNQSNQTPMTSAETLALMLLGSFLAGFTLVGRAPTLAGDIAAIVLSTGIVLILLTIQDMGSNRPTHNFSALLIRQRFFVREKLEYYLPNHVLTAKWLPATNVPLICRTRDNSDKITRLRFPQEPMWLTRFVDAVFYLFCIGLIVRLVF